MSYASIVATPSTQRRSRSSRTGPPSTPYTDRLRVACREGKEGRRPVLPDWCHLCKGVDTVGQNLVFVAGRAGQFIHYCSRCNGTWYPPQRRPSREQLRRIEAIRTEDEDEQYARQLDVEINGTPLGLQKTRKRKNAAAPQGDDEVARVDGAETTFGDGPQPPAKKSKKHRALGAVNRALDKVATSIAREQKKKRGPSTVVEIALSAAAKASNNTHASGAEYQGLDLLTTGLPQTQNNKVTGAAVVKPALNDQKAKHLTHKTGATCSPSTQASASNVSDAAEQRDGHHLGEYMAQVRAGYPRWHQPPYRDGEDRGENSGGRGGEGAGQGSKALQNTMDVRVVFWTQHRSRPRIVRARMGMGELRLADYPALMDYLGLDAETQWDWWLEGPQTWRSNMVVSDGFYVSFATRTILGRVQLQNHNDGGRFQGVVGLMNLGEEVDRLRDGMYGIELDQDVEYIPDLDDAGELHYDLS